MFQEYKEIFFGLFIGLGAAMIDIGMDAASEGYSYSTEIVAHPSMMLYRGIFVVLGAGLGWLLWQRNRREREFRRLNEKLDKIQADCGRLGILLSSKLQAILTRDDLHLSEQAHRLVHEAYQLCHELQTFTGKIE
ncbi:MAG TPA: hypothetical protein VKB58_16750 [Terriglobales bacterium]|jgi:hypothetical protein|nr:hypothetical protein [Terriglobales bacterium]